MSFTPWIFGTVGKCSNSNATCPTLLYKYHLIYRKTSHRQVLCQFQFPEHYPEMPILMEIKSKVFSVKVAKLLNDRCDEEAKKLEGRAQVNVLSPFNMTLSFNICKLFFYGFICFFSH